MIAGVGSIVVIGWIRDRAGVNPAGAGARAGASPATQTSGAGDDLAELRRLHDHLAQTIQRAEAVFLAQQLPDTRSPERADLAGIFEHTGAIATALADFLDAIDRVLANEGSGASEARLSPAQVRAFLLDVEPPPQQGPEFFHPGAPRRPTAIGKLPGAYGYHIDLDNRLHARRIRRSYAWRESVALWHAFTYSGGTNAVTGLLARLDRISDIHGIRREPRTNASGGTLTVTEGGQRVMTFGAVPPEQTYPWDRRDIAELRRVAQRAAVLATATDESLLEQERHTWCQAVDAWLQAGPGAGSVGAEFLGALIAEAPAADAQVNERLEKLANLADLPEALRAQARAKLR